jgi:biopolymer transport protein ExbB
MNLLILTIIPLLASASVQVDQANPHSPPKDFDALLSKIEAGWRTEKNESKKRLAIFNQAKDRQKILLQEAQEELVRWEQQSSILENKFSDNQKKLADLSKGVNDRLGDMASLVGVIRQMAGDTLGHLRTSLVSAQYPGRDKALADFANSNKAPSIDQLRSFWLTLQKEMIESGRSARFQAPVVLPSGEVAQREVVRAGLFNALSAKHSLIWLPESQKLSQLGRQPASRYTRRNALFSESVGGWSDLAIDPSRGALLSLLVQHPTTWERVSQGGFLGFLILGLGGITLLVALARLFYLLATYRRLARQEHDPIAQATNPLGRVFQVYHMHSDAHVDALENKLDEVILKEQAKLDRFLWAFKVVAAAAPLMGLLGTVTGMIQTFQAITLFGTGDPKLMADGISVALVTTMLGLCVAIPLLLLHSALKSLSQRMMNVLGEQSAGMVASKALEAK